MRFILSMSMIAALAVFAACQQAATSSTETRHDNPADAPRTASNDAPAAPEPTQDDHAGHDHGEDAPRISLADAKKAFDAGEAVFVDTRSAVNYKTEHIKGAINVPAGEFEQSYKQVPADKKIITYCS